VCAGLASVHFKDQPDFTTASSKLLFQSNFFSSNGEANSYFGVYTENSLSKEEEETLRAAKNTFTAVECE